MLYEDGEFSSQLIFTRFFPLNDDQSIPFSTTVDSNGKNAIIGGAGPFDFSGVTDISAVDITVQLDNAAASEFTIDLSAAVAQAAVTVAELVVALDAAFLAEGILLDASTEAVTGRLFIETSDTSDPPDYVQIYGEAAELAMIGQGFGMKCVKSDTMKSIGFSLNMKDQATRTTTTGNDKDVDLITDGYVKGGNLTLVEAAEDWEEIALLTGATYDESVAGAETVEDGDYSTEKIYFCMEVFYAIFSEGENKIGNLIEYVKVFIRSAMGQAGDETREANWSDQNFSVVATGYKNPDTGARAPWRKRSKVSITAYAALDVENV